MNRDSWASWKGGADVIQKSDVLTVVCLGVVGLLGALLFARSGLLWWYQDDASLVAKVSTLSHPWAIFSSSDFCKEWAVGASLAPMHAFSYWCDYQLFGASTFAFHFHSLAVGAGSGMLGFLLFRSFGVGKVTAWGMILVWWSLPSVLVVHGWVSARHYSLGLFLLLAMLLVDRLGCPSQTPLWLGVRVLVIALLGALAMLCKEFYAVAVPALLAWTALERKSLGHLALATLLAFAYAAYYGYLIGFDNMNRYPTVAPWPGLRWTVFSTLSLHLSQSWAGIGMILFLIVALPIWIFADLRKRWLAGAGIIGMVITIFIVMSPTIVVLWMMQGTVSSWERMYYAMAALLIGVCGWGLGRFLPRKVSVAAVTILLIVQWIGVLPWAREWFDLRRVAGIEGRFYVATPGTLIFTTRHGTWEFDGLNELYPGEGRLPVVNFLSLLEPEGRELVQDTDEIYTYRDGELIKVTSLQRYLLKVMEEVDARRKTNGH